MSVCTKSTTFQMLSIFYLKIPGHVAILLQCCMLVPICRKRGSYCIDSLTLKASITTAADNIHKYFYAPSFGEVEEAYWFGPVRPSVCPSVRPSVCPSIRNSLAAEKLKNRLC